MEKWKKCQLTKSGNEIVWMGHFVHECHQFHYSKPLAIFCKTISVSSALSMVGFA